MPVALPKFLKSAFAAVGIKNNIPDASNNATGRAGYDKGFPEINMQPREAGGIPPAGGDMNGVLYDLSSAIQYIQSGIRFPFNQDFASSIGGYSVGAIVSSDSDASTLWINSTSNNQVFPAGWTSFKYGDPTETVRGTPLVASQSEVNLGIDDKKIITPKKIRNGFSINLSVNGHILLPTWLSGLIIQWGSLETSLTSPTPVTFSIPFPVGPFVINGTPNASSSVNATFFGQTSSGVNWNGFDSTNGQRVVTAIYWIAIGR